MINRSLNLTKELVSDELPEQTVVIIEKNTPKDLNQRFVVIDDDHQDYKNLVDDYGKENIEIPFRSTIDTIVEKTIPAIEEGQEPTEKTPEEVQSEIAEKFKDYFKMIISSKQKVLDKIIEENIDVVRTEVEEEKLKAEQEEAEQPPAEEPKPEEPADAEQQEAQAEDEKDQENKVEQEGEGEVIEEPKIGLYPELITSLYASWKQSEKEYAGNMIKFFKLVQKQNESLESGLDETKADFKGFLNKPDGKQEKLEHFIESFNKFTEEFPELRPDEQTKEELNNRCDMLNDDFWEIIEQNKDLAIAERQRIMELGWIDHETQQLILKAQQFINFEIKRCTDTMSFIHDFYLSKKAEKPLNEYEGIKLSLLDQSNARSEVSEVTNIEKEMISKTLGIISEVDAIIEKQDPSDFEIIEAFKRERSILLFRICAIRNWTINGLKDIKIKINEMYNQLDDWIVAHVKQENLSVNETVSKIREVIESIDPLEPDFKIIQAQDTKEGEDDDVQFIETIVDKSFIDGRAKMKFSLYQAQQYSDIFKRFTKDENIEVSQAREIFVVNIKLNPDMIPEKWTKFPLTHIDELVNTHVDEETGLISWRQLLTYCIVIESFIPMVDRDAVTGAYLENLKKIVGEDLEEYIELDQFLKVNCWYDTHLAMRRKEDVKFEEDKEEIDQEIQQIKELLFNLNVSSNGKLHIENYIQTLLKLWPQI